MRIQELLLLLLLSLSVNATGPSLDKALPELTLSGETGGRLDGSSWSLKETITKNKVTIIFYVDPDVKDRNEEISQVLSKRNFSKEKVQYLAIINMAASWLPNFAIASALKKKQQKYPNTLYLKDFSKIGVKTWKVEDDENNIVILNPEGKVIFSHSGEVKKESFDKVLKLIESNIK